VMVLEEIREHLFAYREDAVIALHFERCFG
jgi:hypothetical protein